MGSTHQNDDQQSSFHQPELGGFGASPLFGYQKQDQIVTPNAPPQQAPPQSGSNCSGNCGACVWSFLCKNASKKLATLGSSFVPKLG
ncbi:hypothetical protein TRFO_12358 [Tritrichomonas foetus]|uniref:Uncharacterized protein n=1 Tax=Tritrichomonas foetus TaxID=1144522 RepID=A0A1J4L5W3_9EUKA|nr:hypothetical protein TRFO_12358 [Tritrichomonas foetus]|eukprot:OHT17404.1 hypothetical protein TRFO_12358 [Tritrichomonas foetus]